MIAGIASLLAHKAASAKEVLAFGNAGHSAHAGHGAGGHAADHHDDHGHDDHHAPEVSPHSEGISRFSEVITTGFLAISCVLAWTMFFQVAVGSVAPVRVTVAEWIHVGALSADWALRVDTLTAVMLVVVTSVSMLVHLYSIGYMHEDPARPRFMAYLSLFTFAMLMLVTSDNLMWRCGQADTNGDDVGLQNAMALWAERLAGFAGRPDAIRRVLDTLPKHPPTLPECVELCRSNCPQPKHKALPAPGLTAEQIAERQKAAEQMARGAFAAKPPGKWWPEKLRARFLSGEKLTFQQIEMASDALARSGQARARAAPARRGMKAEAA